MTPEARRRRTAGQILLLAAALSVLVAISAFSVALVSKARTDSGLVVRTVEVESYVIALLLDIRRAESAARGYMLTLRPDFLRDHDSAVANILPGLETLTQLTRDNPIQVENCRKMRSAVEIRLGQFAQQMDLIKQGDPGSAITLVREAADAGSGASIREIGRAMRAEEDRQFVARTATADRTQQLASVVTVAGSGLVVALAGFSILLVRRSSRARDAAETKLRDSNLTLEAMVDERTADLREANEEIQRFAYIVSHDLRSPLVNIMGFTSELEQLRGDIFRRIAALASAQSAALPVPENATDDEAALKGADKQLADDFSEALGFIKSSIAKMDRLISAILDLTREGRREFDPVPINTRELIEGIVKTVAHQAAEAHAKIRIENLPNIVSDRLALEQIFSNLIDNAVKYLETGVPGEISVRGRTRLGFAIFEIADNGRGIDPKDHQRIFDLFRRAGTQDRPGQGIGLAHVRALVRRLGGTMSVASEVRRGSTFTITLPLNWPFNKRNERA
ncbi:ATP-binding protein [Bradyrhizobium sp.]|uniref:sensor histidine kinase n=1 Tax=Bradyrhizobium sp. TaxID=376 RepID=UPI0025C4F55F|nr:ATP-binding protein [Bradyrhizobium sp.]